MRHLILFQTYIEIFNKIERVNLAALVVSSMTIVALVINDILKVSTGQLSLFLCVTMCMYVFNGSYLCHFQKHVSVHICVCVCVCVCVRACAELHSTHMMWKHKLLLVKEANLSSTMKEKSIPTRWKLPQF